MANSDARLEAFLGSTVDAADNTSAEQKDPFWYHPDSIDAARWSQVFPYQFMLVKKTASGYVQDAETKKWTFTLPFPPSALSVGLPFAIGGGVTQGGFTEEHGGIPVKPISLRGSLGVLPLRPRAPIVPTENLGAAIFAGTIQQAQQTATAAKRLAADLGGPSPYRQYLVDDRSFSEPDVVGKTSGWYQFQLLTRFFENYAAFRMTSKGRDYRLAFAMWKHQSVYLVKPVSIDTSYDASSPLEPQYSVQLQAWRRINLDSVGVEPAGQYQPAARRPNGLGRLLQALLDARAVLENARDVLSALGGDVDRSLFEPLRQATLFAKDALALPLAFADLPNSVLQTSSQAVAQYLATQRVFGAAGGEFKNQSKSVQDAADQLAAVAGGAGVVGDAPAVGRTRLSDNAPPIPPGLAAYKILRNPERYYDLFSVVQPGRVRLPAAAIRAIAAERAAVRSLTRLDYENMAASARRIADDFSDLAGAGNASYNQLYQRSAPPSGKTPTPADYRVIYALNRVALEFSRLAVSADVGTARVPRSVDYVAGLASRSGIAFQVPRSKFAVPFPYGFTLEKLALRYLQDPDRWGEIATLNGLRQPYVDEVGFDRPLQVNASGQTVQLADGSNLIVAQQVWLSSTTQSRQARRIVKIEQLPGGPTILTLDGDPVDQFKTADKASLHAFLPDTVNSQMLIYIPSDQEPGDEGYATKAIPGINQFDPLLRVAGVDFLLDDRNDLILTPDGDNRWSYGLTNIVQTARIRLGIPLGSLLHHPQIGIPKIFGRSTADVDAGAVATAAQHLFDDDPAFTGVQGVQVVKSGPAAQLIMSVGVRGQSRYVPLVLDL